MKIRVSPASVQRLRRTLLEVERKAAGANRAQAELAASQADLQLEITNALAAKGLPHDWIIEYDGTARPPKPQEGARTAAPAPAPAPAPPVTGPPSFAVAPKNARK